MWWLATGFSFLVLLLTSALHHFWLYVHVNKDETNEHHVNDQSFFCVEFLRLSSCIKLGSPWDLYSIVFLVATATKETTTYCVVRLMLLKNLLWGFPPSLDSCIIPQFLCFFQKTNLFMFSIKRFKTSVLCHFIVSFPFFF